ncbi:MAG: SpoIIE family protein phosphatase [Bacteroidales bacterium]|nr:SpoIIE family protein phosphatase [Bacteroidales bacterium]
MKRLNIYILFLIILVSIGEIKAQTPLLRQHQLFRGKEKYTVNVVFQDPKGWMWFGTDNGLFRFDGINYVRFTVVEGLATNNVTALGSNKDGRLWIGHEDGEISIYNGNTIEKFNPEEGMGTKKITDIALDSSGVIWFSTSEEGVYRYDGRYLTNVNIDDGLSDNHVYDIEVARDGTLWFATDYGITQYSKGQCSVLSMKDGLADNIVRVLKASPDGRIWAGTQDMGLIIFDPKKNSFTTLDGWDYGAITGFVMSLEDNIWISTERQGIVQLQLTKGLEKPYYKKITQKQGLISERINAIIKDSEENIWVGGYQGVVQALPAVFEFLNKENGSPFEMVYSIASTNEGNLWVCSESGLFRGIQDNSGQFIWSNILNLTGINFISLYFDKKGFIWAGSYGDGVYRINPKNLQYKKFTVAEGLSDNNVSAISGNDSVIWFSTFGGGVSKFLMKSSRFDKIQNEEIAKSYIYQTRTDLKGRTWIAGTLRYPAYFFSDSLHSLDTDGQKFPQLYSIATDSSGMVWFNTKDDGLLVYNGDSIEKIGEKKGIAFKDIQSIIFDKYNNLLVISDFGFLFYQYQKGVILEFGENTGLSYQYPILNSVYSDSEGQIWIGTQSGIIKYNPAYLKFIKQSPRVFLSEKKLFSTPISNSKKRFRYNENNFTFAYTGIWFRNPEALTYRYMLEGFDLKWNYFNQNQSLTYSKLPAGDYTFKVEVSLNQKTWFSSPESSFSFKVSPPFWMRWWFILLMAIMLVSGIFLYIRIRLYNLNKAKEELEVEVYKRTEEIRNQNEELETQKEEIAAQRDMAEDQRDKIEAQKDEIQASIRYAHRLQSAALPPKTQLDLVLGDYFILNKPRDIVSGDFFWVAKNETHKFFAVGDCTGHGVPGAFMSMLGLSALNDIVKSLDQCTSSQVLNLLRNRVRESLHQGGESETVANDGMDISLCIYEPETGTLQFSAAHNPLYIIRNGELMVVEADKMEIGSYLLEKREFTNNIIQCQTGDIIYLFSDGFADQFGGESGKKYKYKQFRDFILSIHSESMQKQKWLLDEEIEAWRGLLPQVDDIMVLGVRLA